MADDVNTLRRQMMRLARDETAASIGALVEIRDNLASPASVRAAASIYLLDRAWGRPHQAIAVVEEVRKDMIDPRAEELKRQLLKMLDKGASLAGPTILVEEEDGGGRGQEVLAPLARQK